MLALCQLFLFGILYFFYYFPIYKKETQQLLPKHLLMFAYLSLVLCLTIYPLPLSIDYSGNSVIQSINFFPFRDLIKGYHFALQEIIFNILLFLPYGCLLPKLTNYRLLKTIFSSFLFSLTIEVTQAYTILFNTDLQRVTDLTDIVTNTVGGSLGYLLYKLFNQIKEAI